MENCNEEKIDSFLFNLTDLEFRIIRQKIYGATLVREVLQQTNKTIDELIDYLPNNDISPNELLNGAYTYDSTFFAILEQFKIQNLK